MKRKTAVLVVFLLNEVALITKAKIEAALFNS